MAQFDAGEVREEFALIRDLGMTPVRIFLLWDDFQPAPDQVSAATPGRPATVCRHRRRAGAEAGYYLLHRAHERAELGAGLAAGRAPVPAGRQVVSGGQVVHRGYRNPFTDPSGAGRRAPAALHRGGANCTTTRRSGLWNLGNEPDLFAWPPNAAAGRAWVREMWR